MSTLLRFFAVACISLLGTVSASAHPGHGEPGPTHYVTEAAHVVPGALAVAAILCVAIVVKLQRQKRTASVRT